MIKTHLFKRSSAVTIFLILLFTGLLVCFQKAIPVKSSERLPLANRSVMVQSPNQVLEWNQIFIETLNVTNTPNSSSQRLGAIVHTAIFDAYNGIERRYTPVFVHNEAPRGASRRAAVIAAAYVTLINLFPDRKPALDISYDISLAGLSDDDEDGGQSRALGIAWGTDVANAVLAWRANDGFNPSPPRFDGGMAVGQWRPTPPLFGGMSAQGLAFTAMFALDNNIQFRPGPPRGLTCTTYTEDFNTVKRFGRKEGSMRTPEQTLLAFFWEGNASIHWNQGCEPACERQPPIHFRYQSTARGP